MDIRTSSGLAIAARLHAAVNRHDLDAMVGCFAVDFVNETPAHPARSFRGRDQVRKAALGDRHPAKGGGLAGLRQPHESVGADQGQAARVAGQFGHGLAVPGRQVHAD